LLFIWPWARNSVGLLWLEDTMHKSVVMLALALSLCVSGCSKNPKDRLQGKWGGQDVNKVEGPQKADAAAWAQGIRFEFVKSKMTVSIPSEKARTGDYEVAKASGDTVTIRVARESGGSDAATLRFKGSKLLWDVGDGREVVMTRVE